MTEILKLGTFKNSYEYVQGFKGKDRHTKRTIEGSQKRTRNYFF